MFGFDMIVAKNYKPIQSLLVKNTHHPKTEVDTIDKLFIIFAFLVKGNFFNKKKKA